MRRFRAASSGGGGTFAKVANDYLTSRSLQRSCVVHDDTTSLIPGYALANFSSILTLAIFHVDSEGILRTFGTPLTRAHSPPQRPAPANPRQNPHECGGGSREPTRRQKRPSNTSWGQRVLACPWGASRAGLHREAARGNCKDTACPHFNLNQASPRPNGAMALHITRHGSRVFR
jgi:hypothetical protein